MSKQFDIRPSEKPDHHILTDPTWIALTETEYTTEELRDLAAAVNSYLATLPDKEEGK